MDSLDTMTSQSTSVAPNDQSNESYHESTSLAVVMEGITICIIFLGALAANLVAMTMILRDKLLRRNLHNWLILNLIINDLGFTVTVTATAMISVLDRGYFLLHNKVMCLVSGNVLFAFGNFATVVAISVDRYLAVVWSGRFPSSKPRTIAFIAITWIIAIGSSFPSLFEVSSEIKYKQISHSCSPDWKGNCSNYIILNIIIFGVIVPAMVFCYVGVFLRVWRQQQLLRANAAMKPCLMNTPIVVPSVEDKNDNTNDYGKDIPTDNDKPNESTTSFILTPATSLDCIQSSSTEEPGVKQIKTNKKENTDIHQEIVTTEVKNKNQRSMQKKLQIEKRVALTGSLLVLTTLVCWAPYCVVNSCVLSVRVPHWVVIAAVWLGYSNALYDPLIYTFMNRRIGPHCRLQRR